MPEAIDAAGKKAPGRRSQGFPAGLPPPADRDRARRGRLRLHREAASRYLDLYGGHAVAILGYGHPQLVRTIEEQARELFFQSNAVPLRVRATAGRKLVGFAPPGLDRVFLVNSGAEANENALRLAFRLPSAAASGWWRSKAPSTAAPPGPPR